MRTSKIQVYSPHLSEPVDLLDALLCGVVYLFLSRESANTKPKTQTNPRGH